MKQIGHVTVSPEINAAAGHGNAFARAIESTSYTYDEVQESHPDAVITKLDDVSFTLSIEETEFNVLYKDIPSIQSSSAPYSKDSVESGLRSYFFELVNRKALEGREGMVLEHESGEQYYMPARHVGSLTKLLRAHLNSLETAALKEGESTPVPAAQ